MYRCRVLLVSETFMAFFVCEPHRSEGGNVRPKDFKRLGQTQVRILRQALTAWLLFSISVLIKFRSHHALFNVLIRTWHVVSDSFLSFLQILNNNKNCKGQFTHSRTHPVTLYVWGICQLVLVCMNELRREEQIQ